MDAAAIEEAQGDHQADDSPETTMAAAIRAAMLEVHTTLPGKILSFDPVKQTAKVQPLITRLFVGIGNVQLPACLDVPVVFPRGGGYVMTFPVAAGDECKLEFSERAIDFWWKNGGVQLPAKPRMHSLSDAFATVGPSSLPNKIPSFSTSAVEIRKVDGTGPAIALDGSNAYLGGIAGAAAAVLEPFIAILKTYTTAIQGIADPTNLATPALHTALDAPGVVSTKGKVL